MAPRYRSDSTSSRQILQVGRVQDLQTAREGGAGEDKLGLASRGGNLQVDYRAVLVLPGQS